ncbi:pantoate kinase [Methanolapillus africanus]
MNKGKEFSPKTVFCPGHITGFFQICNHDDPHQKGSIGCGIALDKGLLTTVNVSANKTEVILNGKKEPGETTLAVVSEMKKRAEMKYNRSFEFSISGVSDFPPGSGFGISAAGALGAAFAINESLNLGLSRDDLVEMAHVAEVKAGSGLGDVAGESLGGLVLREKPGGAQFGKFYKIPAPEKKVFCLVMGELSTKDVISNPEHIKAINDAGKKAMENFRKTKTIESFMKESFNFTNQIGLLSSHARKAIDAVDENMGMAAQAMLGNTVFAMTKDFKDKTLEKEAEEHILKTFQKYGTVYECKIGNHGPTLI